MAFSKLERLEFGEIHSTSLDRDLLLQSCERRAGLKVFVGSTALAVSESFGEGNGVGDLGRPSSSVREIWSDPNTYDNDDELEDWPERAGDFDDMGSPNRY